ncbi:hypothetical protein BDQ94DRAFT_177479 [Aspergillus welwitschiae]|uniref:GED domain-containing protein n=1 Tax=Aspergillus welwitschiae TaxID=1341132 RepID=A0A3F3PJH8_9EURO|nr:hypothetical protein BDQ94DRAFT_177479 [Aspergillus welwitschiae]RDH26526.1 hypothetical protein BDQ94DRAFT_177479 [Aspergillus welwitschiae]
MFWCVMVFFRLRISAQTIWLVMRLLVSSGALKSRGGIVMFCVLLVLPLWAGASVCSPSSLAEFSGVLGDTNVGIRVSIVPHHSRSEVEQRSLGSFREELDGFDELPQLVDNAKTEMGISTHGKAISNDLLRIEVSGPDRPHLTIVDLPGLVHSETKHQSAPDVQLVQEVVQSYMKQPRSVITKPNTLVANSASERIFISLAKNRDIGFRLGWHALRDMDTAQGTWTLSDRDQKEQDFFSKGAWGEMPSSLVGTGSLRNRLSRLLLRQIAAELPNLIGEIEDKEEDCIQQLNKLGEPRATLDEQRTYLLNISQHLQSLVKAAVDGTYNEMFFEDIQSPTGHQKRIRAVIQNLNEAFAERLNTDQVDGLSGQILVTRGKFMGRIQDLMKRTRGRELPGTFNPMIVSDLFQEQCRPWETITYQHIFSAWLAVEKFMSLVIGYIADEATSAVLFDQVISPAPLRLKEVLTTKCKSLLAVAVDRRAGELRRIVQHFFGIDDLQAPQYLGKYTEPNMMRFASEEALDCMLAYHKVALKRFIDDVAVEAVEVELVQSLNSLFTPIKVYEMPSELVSRIAGESEENRALREQLNKKMQILGSGLSVCRQFVGSRGVSTNLMNAVRRFNDKSQGRTDHTPLQSDFADQDIFPHCGNSNDTDAELKSEIDESLSGRSIISAPQSISEDRNDGYLVLHERKQEEKV